MTVHLHVDRTGVIRFGVRVPAGSLVVASGSRRALYRVAATIARHAYDGRTLLVPGILEATSNDAALDALIAFRRELRRRLGRCS